jgi:hypothetical protein
MKKIFTIISLALTTIVMAQAPQGMNYQATIRNAEGALSINQPVSLRFNIIQGTSTSTAIYQEQHTLTTDDLGSINLVIGNGTALTGTFSQINWALGNYFLGIEVNSGFGYVSLGTTQMLSVPYALYATTSGSTSTDTILLSKIKYEGGQSITADFLVPSYNDDYVSSGYAVALTPNPTPLNSLEDNESFVDEFRFQSDLSFYWETPLPVGTTLYVRAWIKKTDGTYVYSQQRTITTN